MPDGRRHRAVAAGLGVGGLLLAVTGGVFAVAAHMTWTEYVDNYALTNTTLGLSFLLSGATIGWFKAHNHIGRLLILSGWGAIGTACADGMLDYGLDHQWSHLALRGLAAVYSGAWQLGIGLCFNIAVLLFPTDRQLSARWRPVLWLTVVSGVYQLGSTVLSGESVYNDDPRTVSILSIGLNTDQTVLGTIMGDLTLALTALTLATLIVRYRRGDERVKRQVLWVLLALLAIVAINTQRWFTGNGPILLLLSFALIPAAIGVAITRYQLFDIRLVLSRTFLYLTTIVVILAGYGGLVALLTRLIADDLLSSSLTSGVPTGAALVVAIAFNPVRLRLQRVIDRAFYGTRGDPAGTARHIAAHLSQTEELTDVLDRARQALNLPWMALTSAPDGNRLAEAGTRRDTVEDHVVLTYHGQTVGTLHVALRRGDSTLHDADRRTLDLIGTPLAIALHATTLTHQLRQARAATVEASVAERARLQRELHDELGPTLTSIAFRADAATNVLHTDVDESRRLLRGIRSELRAVVDSVRRIVYGLRPVELQDLGLAGALRQHLDAIPAQRRNNVRFDLTIDHPLPPLSPAVELAAYRIAVEGVTNTLRHSNGTVCTVDITAGDDLVINIRDNGPHRGTWQPGVGLHSIHDRAEELGGTATTGAQPDGWQIRASLPLRDSTPAKNDRADDSASDANRL